MPYEIVYQGEAEGLSVTQINNLINVVSNWSTGSSDRRFEMLNAYPEVGRIELRVRITDVTALESKISDLDSGISSINSDIGVNLPSASERLQINSR